MHSAPVGIARNEQVRGSIPLPGSERNEEQEGPRGGRGDENHASPSIPLPGSDLQSEQDFLVDFAPCFCVEIRAQRSFS